MATYVPAKRNTAFIFYASLVSQADTKLTKANPTLAAGDFQVSIDGGALANLTTLPTVTPASGRMVKFSLSSAEMNGDNITVVCSDVAGAEWCDATFSIQTAARQVDDLAYPATSGRSIVVDAAGLVDANMVKSGPTGSGTAQTASDIGASLATIAAYIDTEVAAIKAKTDNLPASPANEATLTTISGYIDTEVAAIKAKTDNLPVDPADASDVAAAFATVNATLATIAAYVDTEVAAIKAKTDQLTFTSANKVDATLQAAGDFAQAAADKVWATTTRTLTSSGAIKKNTALTAFEFFMTDSADHVTGKTGLTVTATRSLDGAAFAACANSVTEVSAGVYKLDLAAADLNADVVTLKFTGSGADATLVTIKTAP